VALNIWPGKTLAIAKAEENLLISIETSRLSLTDYFNSNLK